MSTDRCALPVAKKACTRCSAQKRRCDRAMPDCGLCTRLRHKCKYDIPRASSWAPTPSPSPRPGSMLGSVPFTPSHLKDAVILRLEPLTPKDTFSAYCRAIEPWFPIVSIPRLQRRLSLTWDETPLDFAILCLSIILFTTSPPSSPEDENDPSEFNSRYLFTKSVVASTEGLGINSFWIVQSRILLTLFEVAHGFYPAAYISIGATSRAAEALAVHPGADASSCHALDCGAKREEEVSTWCSILILDRYIAMESGPRPSLSRCRSEVLHDIHEYNISLTYDEKQSPTSPKYRLSHLFGASSLLDNIHAILNNSTPDHATNVEELILTIQKLINLETILTEGIGDGIQLYSSGFGLCNTALLLAFENGTKVPITINATKNETCKNLATTSLISVLSTITSIVELFTFSTHSIDFDRLPPFVGFLVYKAAAIITERLPMDSDSDEKMRILKILRNFLRIVGERWLGCKRYLMILNEDTTPRTLKALEQK